MKLNKKTMLVIIYVLINTMLLVLFLNDVNNNKTRNLEQYLFFIINYPTSTVAFLYFESYYLFGTHYSISKLEDFSAYLNYFAGFIQWYYIIFLFKKKDLKKIKIISLLATIIVTITLIFCNDIKPYFHSKYIGPYIEGNLACCDKDADTY